MARRNNKEISDHERIEFHISDEDISHRKDFANFARSHSDQWYRPRLERLYDRWNQWNEDFFYKKMAEPYLMISSLTGKGTMGLYQNISSFGGKSVIRINRLILTGEFEDCAHGNRDPEGLMRIAEDTLLHEMIHQYANEHLFQPEPSQRGHGVTFRDECNRIAEQLGWETKVRISKKTKTNAHLPSCAQWPDEVRPDQDDYYLGAWINSPNPSKRGIKIKIQEEQILSIIQDYEEDPKDSPEGQAIDDGPAVKPQKVSPKEWKILFAELNTLSNEAQAVVSKIAKLHGVRSLPTET